MRPAARSLPVCLAVFALAGCGAGGYAPDGLPTVGAAPPASSSAAVSGRPAVVTVVMRNLAFAPRTITIRAGGSVEWVNRDDVHHNVTTLDGATIASPDISPGGRFAYVPARPGRLRYYCTIHPSTMYGELVVRAG